MFDYATLILSFALVIVFASVLTYFISKKIFHAHVDIIISQAQAKARAIEQEQILKFEKAQSEIENRELKAKIKLDSKTKELDEKLEQVKSLEHACKAKNTELDKLTKDYKDANKKLIQTLSSHLNLTQSELKKELLSGLERELQFEKEMMIARYVHQAKEEAKSKANFILGLATARYAGEYAVEKLVSVINLSSEDEKGKIIGKEGRNIKAFESITGVEIIIDDSPQIITLSCFNLYRRAIAVRTMEKLIEDGRIQPARIEEIYEKVCEQMEEEILESGKHTVLELGLFGIHKEILKLIGRLKYRTSYGQNALAHSIEVAKFSRIIAVELGGNGALATRAGLLHDIGKSIDNEINFENHVSLGVKICKQYGEPDVVLNAILAHHGHEEIKSIEVAAVCAADALSAGRPGARREGLDRYLVRMSEIENIANSKFGVKQAYAINAGREVRVIVRADELDDLGSASLSREIASEIEKNLQYPGSIKVNVIRERRFSAHAR